MLPLLCSGFKCARNSLSPSLPTAECLHSLFVDVCLIALAYLLIDTDPCRLPRGHLQRDADRRRRLFAPSRWGCDPLVSRLVCYLSEPTSASRGTIITSQMLPSYTRNTVRQGRSRLPVLVPSLSSLLFYFLLVKSVAALPIQQCQAPAPQSCRKASATAS